MSSSTPGSETRAATSADVGFITKTTRGTRVVLVHGDVHVDGVDGVCGQRELVDALGHERIGLGEVVERLDLERRHVRGPLQRAHRAVEQSERAGPS